MKAKLKLKWLAALLLAGASSSPAADFVWTGEVDNSWDTAATNWSGAAWQNGIFNSAVFNTGGGEVVLAENIKAGTVAVNAAGYAFDTNGHELSTIGLEGTAPFTKKGPGALLVTGDTLAHSGGIAIEGGGVSLAPELNAPGKDGAFDIGPDGTLKIDFNGGYKTVWTRPLRGTGVFELPFLENTGGTGTFATFNELDPENPGETLSDFNGTLKIGGSHNPGNGFVRVQLSSLGTDASVEVSPSGQFWNLNRSGVYPNDFTIQGVGGSEGLGAVRVSGGATYSGTIAIDGSARISGTSGSNIATFSGKISGGSLELGGGSSTSWVSSYKLTNNDNDHDSTVFHRGTLFAGGEGVFGAGSFTHNGGALSSDSSAPRTFANEYTIGGNITLGNMVNNGKLTFTNSTKVTGARNVTTHSDVEFTAEVDGSPSGKIGHYGPGKLTLSGGGTLAGNHGAYQTGGAGVFTLAGTWTDTGLWTQEGAGEAEIHITGDVTSNKGSIIGQNTANHTGILNISGTYTHQAANIFLGNNVASATGVVNVLEGGLLRFVSTADFILGRDRAQGVLNLNGGTVETVRPIQDSNNMNDANNRAIINFDGGTMRLGADMLSLFLKTKSLTTMKVFVKEGGAIIDTNGYDAGAGLPLEEDPASPGGGLVKTGDGIFMLAGENTWSGPTVIEQGTLGFLPGAAAEFTAGVEVAAGASLDGGSFGAGQSLSGTGTLAGTVDLSGGGDLSPAGNAAHGAMQVDGHLRLGGTLVMQVTKAGGAYAGDLLAGTGSIALAGKLVVTLDGATPALGDRVPLFTNSGGRTGSFNDYDLPTLGVGTTWDYSQLAATGELVVSDQLSAPWFNPAPEPHFGDLEVTVSALPGAHIHYTLDGSIPTQSSPGGIGPVIFTVPAGSSITVKAMAVQDGLTSSVVGEQTYQTHPKSILWVRDGDGDWSDAGNWRSGIIPDGVGAHADFHTTPQTWDTTVTLDSDRTVESIGFGSAAGYDWFILSDGPTITMAGTEQPSITLRDGVYTTVEAPLRGKQGLVVSGDGNLMLAAANSYKGGTLIGSEATLAVGKSGALPAGDDLELQGVLDLNGISVTIGSLTGVGQVDNLWPTQATLGLGAGGGSFTFDGTFASSSGDLAVLKTGAGTLSLTGVHENLGNTLVQGGTLELLPGSSMGSEEYGQLLIDGGLLKVAGGDFAANTLLRLGDSAPGEVEITAGTLRGGGGGSTNLLIGQNHPGVINVSGGEVVMDFPWMAVGNMLGSAGSAINVSGGSFGIPGPGESIHGFDGEPYGSMTLGVRSSSSINLSGDGLFTMREILLGHPVTPAGVVSTINLDGGILAVEIIRKPGGSGTAVMNFNGGLLRVTDSEYALLSGLSAANVRDGGARIDTNGFYAYINQHLGHSPAEGDAARDGGLIKTGEGELILASRVEYTGDTVVEEGELIIDYNAALVFTPGANGVGNRLTGPGAVTIDGSFGFNLAGASIADGNQWLVVDAPDTYYGFSFQVEGFLAQDDGTHVLVDGLRTWTFDESTGVLSLGVGTPEDDYGVWAVGFGWNPGDPGTAPDEDYDGDGVSNAAEWLFGLDPESGESLSPVVSVPRQGSTVFSYTRRMRFLTNADYAIEWSVSLREGAWTRIASGALPEAIAPVPGTDNETVTVDLGLLPGNPFANDRLFFRVVAEAP